MRSVLLYLNWRTGRLLNPFQEALLRENGKYYLELTYGQVRRLRAFTDLGTVALSWKLLRAPGSGVKSRMVTHHDRLYADDYFLVGVFACALYLYFSFEPAHSGGAADRFQSCSKRRDGGAVGPDI